LQRRCVLAHIDHHNPLAELSLTTSEPRHQVVASWPYHVQKWKVIERPLKYTNYNTIIIQQGNPVFGPPPFVNTLVSFPELQMLQIDLNVTGSKTRLADHLFIQRNSQNKISRLKQRSFVQCQHISHPLTRDSAVTKVDQNMSCQNLQGSERLMTPGVRRNRHKCRHTILKNLRHTHTCKPCQRNHLKECSLQGSARATESSAELSGT
jgi:hypothetical protein